MSTVSLRGLQHVTVFASDPQTDVDFYTTLLGLRLVEQTVDFDAPDSYHLCYGDAPAPRRACSPPSPGRASPRVGRARG
jgi:catechol 2,3-dioxygenase-like lactoylglutathione lyase family enzyme